MTRKQLQTKYSSRPICVKQQLATASHAALKAAPGVAFTLLLPKCPLCVAALLTSLGLGGALALRLAPWLHAAWFSIGCAAIAAPLIIWLLYSLRARRCACANANLAQPSSRRT